jgi:EAL domain-containing protein (putative c-di-GMP-specific phosphodiesterase class I)/GGDEF domain-containing protein
MPFSHEAARLAALQQLDLLDTGTSEAFDRITRMAAQIFGLPIAAVSLTDQDRQWFKSRVGVAHQSIPRQGAPCSQVAETTRLLVIPDLLADPDYRDCHLARSGIRFYAGAPLTTHDGFGLGAMCVLGAEPREALASELAALGDLAAMTMAQVELQHAFGRTDPLSGMPNRVQFAEDMKDLVGDRPCHEPRLAVLIEIASPEEHSSAVRVMGASYFDTLVANMARTVRAAIGPTAKAYHVTATQFAFLAEPGSLAAAYLPRLEAKLDLAHHSVGTRYVTTPAAGLVPFELGRVEPQDVLRMAHGAAQEARKSAVTCSIYSADQDRLHARRFELINDFAAALEAPDQLRLVFQPRVDLATGACQGAEVLLRWRHPTLGEVSPGEFMPLVEQTSMARAATAWVLEAALHQLSRWRSAGHTIQLSVNISAANLQEADFATRLTEALTWHALPAACLELELTESAVMQDAGKALAMLEAIAGAGIRLAIDDFGTGYSSLAYLQRLPAHVVKVDQSFVRGLAGDVSKQSLVATMTALSHDLGYRVVAEGVETEEVLRAVTAAGCDEAQGFLFGRPMPAGDFLDWWREGQRPQGRPFQGRHTVAA